MKLFLKSFLGKINLVWHAFKGWLLGKVSTQTLAKTFNTRVIATKNSDLDLVVVQLPEARIRRILQGKRDFIVQITAQGEVTASCKTCSNRMSLSRKDEFLWFYCHQCRRISFDPIANVQRDTGLAIKDGRTLKHEMYFTTKLPPTLKSPFQTVFPSKIEDLSELVHTHSGTTVFREYNLSVNFPNDNWRLSVEKYGKDPHKEFFIFIRQAPWVDSTGAGYSPSVIVTFFSIPNDASVSLLPMIAKKTGLAQIPVERTFGYEGSELELDIPAIGHYGHLDSHSFAGQAYSVYFVFTMRDTTGVAVSLEIVDSVLGQAKPEFYQIMRSIKFIK
jgi:hypothetical protein